MQPTRYSYSNSFKAQVIQECAQSSEMELDTDQLPALVDDLAGRIRCYETSIHWTPLAKVFAGGDCLQWATRWQRASRR